MRAAVEMFVFANALSTSIPDYPATVTTQL
jgi:hypothetical protein